jgi:FMN phosphatase YigB (HAD superfamily)
MPGSATSLTVRGSSRTHSFGVLLVLSDRLDGYDTFLTGRLDIDGASIPVRILTLDDVTVLRPKEAVGPPLLSGDWQGCLYLPHGQRSPNIPSDLAAEVARRRRDLTMLSDAELRYALTFLREATTGHIRQDRINAIVRTLPSMERGSSASRMLISVDVGGTIGRSDGPSLGPSLVAASPLSPSRARHVLRSRLYTLPELSPAVVADVCQELQIAPSSFSKERPVGAFQSFPGSVAAVRHLSYYGTMVTLSNVTCSEVDTDELDQLFSPWIVDHFHSCRTGYAKPDPRAFLHVAEQFNTDIRNLIHIGDDWECDVLGPLSAGARAIYIATSGVPEDTSAADGDVLIASDLNHAASLIGNLVRSPS